ncbi:MAG: DUF721 domain-containing protein [Acidobacteria bacterium]|nr:DUF721 domain-containing protein [Acidobacteriota bacterium]MBI3279546.1 DUF721 domain-containing protein [Acidobacteriota bacterium]
MFVSVESMERAARSLARMKPGSRPISDEQVAIAAWPAAVGKTIAAHTSRVFLVQSRLVIEVADEVWQRQLGTLRDQILQRLEQVLGRPLVRDLEFRLRMRRFEPRRAETARPADEAEGIADPDLRRLYKAARRRSLR